jgi:hypothetical protein
MPLVATSLVMPGALFLEKFEQGGEVCINFHFGGKKGEFHHNGGVGWPSGTRSRVTHLVAISLATRCVLILWKFEQGGGGGGGYQ